MWAVFLHDNSASVAILIFKCSIIETFIPLVNAKAIVGNVMNYSNLCLQPSNIGTRAYTLNLIGPTHLDTQNSPEAAI